MFKPSIDRVAGVAGVAGVARVAGQVPSFPGVFPWL
jgi:hypothetical protein